MKAFWKDPIHGRHEIDAEITIDGLERKTFSGFSADGIAAVTPWPISILMVAKPCGVDFDRLRNVPEIAQQGTSGSLELPEVVGTWGQGAEAAERHGMLLDSVYVESVSHMDGGGTAVNMTASYPRPLD